MDPTGVTKLDLVVSLFALLYLLLESFRLDGPLGPGRRELQELQLGGLAKGGYDVVWESTPVDEDGIDLLELFVSDLLGSRLGVVVYRGE